jgi:carbamoyl-phosphate synthase large subunit
VRRIAIGVAATALCGAVSAAPLDKASPPDYLFNDSHFHLTNYIQHGIDITTVRKIREGRPNLLDHLANGTIDLIVNTPSGKGARTDEGRIRASAVSHGVPCITTIAGARAAVAAMERLREGKLNVYALQDLLSSEGVRTTLVLPKVPAG